MKDDTISRQAESEVRTQMSSANDLISRRLAIDKFAAYIYHAFKDFYRIGLHRKILTPEQCRREARNVLAEVPSAQPKSYREGYQAGFKDAQPEVIRCGECKCWRELPNGCQGFCDMHSTYPTLTDFCSWAERREDNK